MNHGDKTMVVGTIIIGIILLIPILARPSTETFIPGVLGLFLVLVGVGTLIKTKLGGE